MTDLTMVPITIIIPTLNRPDALRRTLNTMLKGSKRPNQIVLIDQSSNERIRNENENLMNHIDSDITVIYYYQREPSLTKARNKGMLLSENDILLFMDDDVDLKNNTIEIIYEIMSNSKIAMIGAIDEITEKSSNNILGYIFGLKSFKYRKTGHVSKAMFGRYPIVHDTEVPTMWAMGYCFVVRGSLCKDWKLKFDEQLTGYAYAEDLDFTYSYYKFACQNGYDCILSKSLKVRHLQSNEYREESKKNINKYVINRAYLGYKHKTGLLGQLAQIWANFGIFLMRLIKKDHPFRMILAQFKCEKIRHYLKKGIIKEEFSD